MNKERFDYQERSQGISESERVSDQTIDAYVGMRLRTQRMLRGMNLKTLSKNVGVSFQQLRKYEIGQNRIGASKLYRFADILGVSVGYFYEGLNYSHIKHGNEENKLCSEKELLQVLHYYQCIENKSARKNLLGLMQSMNYEVM